MKLVWSNPKTAGASAAVALLAMLVGAPSASAVEVTVTIENLAPVNGTFLTPAWVGFHNGDFDLFDVGSPASSALERLAEDGNTGPLASLFLGSGAGLVEGTIPGPNGPIAPGDVASFTFDIDGKQAGSRYFTLASMLIPSNDAFVGVADPTAHQIFGDDGEFLGADFFITGADVLDAGTEVNTELPMHTAFFGQQSPDTGIDENGVIHTHPGYLPVGSGGILDAPQFANGDFTRAGYPVAQVRVTPEPATAVLLAIGLLSLVRRTDAHPAR